jgi:hypothetical protein
LEAPLAASMRAPLGGGQERPPAVAAWALPDVGQEKPPAALQPAGPGSDTTSLSLSPIVSPNLVAAVEGSEAPLVVPAAVSEAPLSAPAGFPSAQVTGAPTVAAWPKEVLGGVAPPPQRHSLISKQLINLIFNFDVTFQKLCCL